MIIRNIIQKRCIPYLLLAILQSCILEYIKRLATYFNTNSVSSLSILKVRPRLEILNFKYTCSCSIMTICNRYINSIYTINTSRLVVFMVDIAKHIFCINLKITKRKILVNSIKVALYDVNVYN